MSAPYAFSMMVILSLVVIMITTKLYWMLSAAGSKDEKAKVLPPGIKLLDAVTAAGFGGCDSDTEPSIAATEDQVRKTPLETVES